jgi:hypothetical protein
LTRALFRPVNALEDALLAARDTGDVSRLLRRLATEDVYIPAPDKPAPDELSLPVIDVEGVTLVPVFTSLTQLARFRPAGGPYVRIRGTALAEIAQPDVGVAINPGGELGLPLTREQLDQLRTPAPAEEEGPEFLIGEPREEPTELLDAIRRFAEDRPEVLAAYRALLVRRPGEEAEPIVGLQLLPGADARPAVDAAAEAASAAGIERLALVPLQEGTDAGEVGRFLVERTQPFWTRATLSRA